MKPGRRRLVQAAGGVALAGAGLVAWRANGQGVFAAGTGPAYEPWRAWREHPPAGLPHLVLAAVLAANPHNSQPWTFRIGADVIDVFADFARNIGAIDPALREMHVGIGCALENLLIAAAHDGFLAQVDLLPDSSHPAHVARVRLARGAAPATGLYDAIPARHTNRAPYDLGRAVDADVLARLAALGPDLPEARVLWFHAPEQRRRIGELVVSATEAIVADRQQGTDSAKWFRTDWRVLQDRRDGITLDAQGLPPLVNFAAKVLPDLDQDAADAAWVRATRERHVATAAAFGLIVVPDAADNAMRIRGGRLWQRMHLWMTREGLAAQPLNQMSERADRERQLGIAPRFGNALKALVGDDRLQALMPFRIGYPTVPGRPSPRRALGSVML